MQYNGTGMMSIYHFWDGHIFWNKIKKKTMEEVTLKSVMQGMKDVDDLKKLGCQCKYVQMGSYKATVWVINPFTGRDTTIDVCVLAEVIYLWNEGIETVESCCGHNKTHGYIAVDNDIHRNRMKGLGYIEYKSNCFYRRGNWWLD